MMEKLFVNKMTAGSNSGRDVFISPQKGASPLFLLPTNVKLTNDVEGKYIACSTPEIYEDWEGFDS